MKTDVRTILIKSGVKNLRESYPGINEENILTDYVYRKLFISCLEQTMEDVEQNHRMSHLKRPINMLILELQDSK